MREVFSILIHNCQHYKQYPKATQNNFKIEDGMEL
jgi:hypothetical protein